MDKYELTAKLRAAALAEGFDNLRIAQARELTEEGRRLEAWLNKGYQGKMQYLENHFEKRIDPRKLVDGAKSVVSLSFNYFPEEQQVEGAPKLAKYAYGEDYHYVLKAKLRRLLALLETELGRPINGRAFVDSAPVLERDWAKHSGLGWIGKNTLLISKQRGSFFFLAELIIDVDLVYDGPIKDYCGRCRRCIEACPTQAISEKGYIMDGSKCISYFTIELRDELPAEYKGQFADWMFGCDICQDVCPWNRFSRPHQEEAFRPKENLLEMRREDWMELTEEVFRKVFKKSAVKRTKYKGLLRNLAFLEDV